MEVYDGVTSYLEDQDFWRLAGIEREVYLYAKENKHEDFTLTADLSNDYEDGIFNLITLISANNATKFKGKLNIKLTREGKTVLKETEVVLKKESSKSILHAANLKKLMLGVPKYLICISLKLN